MGNFCINRSGKTWDVHLSNAIDSEVIGLINENEVFAWTGGWNGNHTGYDAQSIVFLNSQRQYINGWLIGGSGTGCFTNLTTCNVQTLPDRPNLNVFMVKHTTTLLDPEGYPTGPTIPEGSYIATENATCGQTKQHLMHISAYSDVSTPYGWRDYEGFIDIGIRTSGSGFYDLSIAGVLR